MGIGTNRRGTATGPALGPRGIDVPHVTPDVDHRQPITAQALAVLNHAVAELQSDAAAGGLATVTLDPLPAGLVMLVDRLFVACDSAAATTLGVFVGGTDTKNQRDYAPSGNVNVADLTPPIYVGPSQALHLRWEGATDGALAVATIQHRICAVLETPAHRTILPGGA